MEGFQLAAYAVMREKTRAQKVSFLNLYSDWNQFSVLLGI